VDNTLARFVIAFLIGALIGIEREKTQHEDGDTTATGLRTFILISLSGAIAAWLSEATAGPWIFVAAALACAAFIVAGYRSQLRVNPQTIGLTTEFAAFVTFLLGGLTLFGAPRLAVAIAIATSALLAYRQVLHGAVERIGWNEIFAALKLLVIAFIVLPVVPREPVDPWGVINPYAMTWLVLLIAGLSFLGYVVGRWLGPGRGVAVTALAGGLASSTAVTLALAKQSRESAAGAAPTLAGGILLAWAVMAVRVVVACAFVNPHLARLVAIPMGVMTIIAVLGAIVTRLRGGGGEPRTESLQLRNPLSLSFAIKFALVLATIAVLVDRARALVSESAVYVVAALAGVTDVDAITLSMASNERNLELAVTAITLAALVNTLAKTAIVWWVGSRELGARVFPSAAAILAGGLIALFTTR
jgi:uncharacterized membrane protein (DUF4010 family)